MSQEMRESAQHPPSRQDRVAQLARQLGAVVSRRVGLAVGLWGEPGIGKTHAALEVLSRVPCRHLTLPATVGAVNLAQTLPRAKTLPNWALSQLERLERGEVLTPQALAHTLAHTLAASAPFVLHLEDLHEADSERLELVKALARAVVGTRGVGLLVTSRAELPPPFLGRRLEPLSHEETAALVAQELKGGVPPDGLGWVQARTGGNPLFVLEFARYLRRQGFLWSDGERWHWREPPVGFVPVTVEALILELVSKVANTPAARAVLEARAILPDALDSAILEHVWAEVAGVEQEGFDSARDALERGGVLSAEGFTHPLFGEIVRRDLGDARRAEYARRALRALEATDSLLAVEYAQDAQLGAEETVDRLEQAARRLTEAGDRTRAVRLLVRAADCASLERQATLALEAARGLRGLDVLEMERMARLATRSAALRREATFLCATAMQGDGRHGEAWSLLESLPETDRSGLEWWQMHLQYHATAGHNAETVRVWDKGAEFHIHASPWSEYRVISCLLRLSETERATWLIEASLSRADLSSRERARLLDRRNFLDYREARYETVEHTLTEIIGSMTAFPSDCAVYYANRSNARTRLGKYLEARQDAERAWTLSLSIGSLTYNVGFPTALALAQIHLGEYAQAEQVLLEATSLAQHSGHERLWDCYGHLSFLYQRWNPPYGAVLARRYAHLSLEVARSLERDDALVSALEACCRAEVSNAPQVALKHAQELEQVALRTGLREDQTASAYHLGRAYAELGQREQALVHLHRAAELYEARGSHADALDAVLEIDRLKNDIEAARQKLVWFEAHGDAHFASKVRLYFPLLDLKPERLPEVTLPTVRLNVLGPITLERGGQIVRSRARKRLEILAYLLETRIAGRTQASVLELLDALYPGEGEVEARHTLKQQIYLIRSSLGAESVVSTPVGYALGAVSSDAEDFLRSSDPTLWRGPYLEHLGEGWRAGVREALTLALRSSAERLSEENPLEAARLGAVLCQMEPYDAEALRLTVRSLEAAGEVGAARRAYVEGHTRLLEIGVTLTQTQSEFVSDQTLA